MSFHEIQLLKNILGMVKKQTFGKSLYIFYIIIAKAIINFFHLNKPTFHVKLFSVVKRRLIQTTTGSKYGKFSASCDIRSRYVLIKPTFYVENTTKFVLILLFQEESNMSGRKNFLKELVTLRKVTVNTCVFFLNYYLHKKK